jgi:hypothetical protein
MVPLSAKNMAENVYFIEIYYCWQGNAKSETNHEYLPTEFDFNGDVQIAKPIQNLPHL